MPTRTHGKSGTRVYRIWASMLTRCENHGNPAFPLYGGRGITVCSQWSKFENFFSDMGEPPDGLTLERADNDGPYSPKNCVWASRKRQANNRRTNTLIFHNGETKTLASWADQYGIKHATLCVRLYKQNLSFGEALDKPVRGHGASMAKLAKSAECSERTFYRRLQKGWSVERALEPIH